MGIRQGGERMEEEIEKWARWEKRETKKWASTAEARENRWRITETNKNRKDQEVKQ